VDNLSADCQKPPLILWPLAPTFNLATILKCRSKRGRREFILIWHHSFVAFSVISFICVSFARFWFQSWSILATVIGIFLVALCWFRCNEIIYAFVSDALDRLKQIHRIESHPIFQPVERLRMLIISYLEVILYFATIYAILPETWFSDHKLANGFDALYFSIITITTVGYGDLAPVNTVARLLAGYQALIGLLLVVLVIGTYVSDAQRR